MKLTASVTEEELHLLQIYREMNFLGKSHAREWMEKVGQLPYYQQRNNGIHIAARTIDDDTIIMKG